MIRSMKLLWRRRTAIFPEDSDESNGRRKLRVESIYEFGEVVGQGRLGVVHKCIHKATGEEVACKKMPPNMNAYNEMNILQTHIPGGHPGILKVRGCLWAERLNRFTWAKNVHMISELCDGGDLQHFLDEHGHGVLKERHTARIIKSLVQSLQYCHCNDVIHREVKLSSIFILNHGKPSSWIIKLGNFDRSIWKGIANAVRGTVGTLGYSAPEMLCGNGYSYEVDIWSAGVVLYVLLCGKTPFDAEHEDHKSMYKKIQNTELDLSGCMWRSVSNSAKELVLGMLQKDRTQRFSCDQILSHPWILRNVQTDVASSSTAKTERYRFIYNWGLCRRPLNTW